MEEEFSKLFDEDGLLLFSVNCGNAIELNDISQDELTARTIRASNNTFINLCKHWLDLQGYDITKCAPEIAPCPICGANCEVDVAINKHGRAFVGDKKQVYCDKDISCGYRGPIADTSEEAIEKHNRHAEKK